MFSGSISNASVRVDKEATFTCHVRRLGMYKVRRDGIHPARGRFPHFLFDGCGERGKEKGFGRGRDDKLGFDAGVGGIAAGANGWRHR